MIYTQLTRFLFPLALTVIVQELSRQFLSGGMARMPRATETLASFGLAFGLVLFLTSTLNQTRQLSLVLADSRQSFRIVQQFVLLCGIFLAGIVAALAVGPLGTWVIEDLHQLEPDLSTVAREALFWLIPLPILRGLTLFYSGLLIRVRRTAIVSYATLSNIGLSILAVFVLLPLPFIQERPIWLPILVIYVGVLIELGLVFWGHWRYGEPSLANTETKLTFMYVVRFFWPLALIMAIQGMSRPLINLFVSRGPAGTEALAVLTVVYSLGHIPYGWLNEIRNLPPAYKDKPGSLSYIRRFAVGCCALSLSVMVILFWTPVSTYILETLIGLDPDLAAQARVPLIIFSFFPLAVTVRAYLHGIGLLEHRTKAMAPSAPARIGAILAAMIILPTFGVHGATLGVAALYSGFVVETLVVWWGIRGRQVLLQARASSEGVG